MSEDSVKQAARPANTFAFINAAPSTESEREYSRLVVRSHSAQYGQRNRQISSATVARARSSTAKFPKRARQPIREVTSPRASSTEGSAQSTPSHEEGIDDDNSESTRRRVRRAQQQRSAEHNSDEIVADDKNALARRLEPVQALWKQGEVSYFGAASFDPFSCLYETPLSQPLLTKILSYFLSDLIPSLCPTDSQAVSSVIPLHVFDVCREDPALFYSVLFGSLCHFQYRELRNGNGVVPFQKKYTYSARYCKFEAVRHLRRALKNEAYWTSDPAIFNVMILGCHDFEEEQPKSNLKYKFFRQALKGLQRLDVFASLSQDPVHLQALFRLLDSRGGINSITFPGLAAALSYGELLMVARLGSKPTLPFIPLLPSIPCTLHSRLRFAQADVDRNFGPYMSVGLTNEICEVLEAMKIYEGGISSFVFDGDSQKARYIDQRNLIQFHVLNLPPMAVNNGGWKAVVYECCRLGVNIYSLGVTFPLPHETGGHELRLIELNNLLTLNYGIVPKDQHVFEVLLWVVMVAGVAAQEELLRSRFVGFLRHFLPSSTATTFESLKSKYLKKFPWLESACDPAGQEFWDEI